MFLDNEIPKDDTLKHPYSQDVTLENFPNPFIHPSLCNRSGLKYSYICDPNKILSRNIADKVEEILSYQRRNSSHYCMDKGEVPYVLGVALIKKLPYGISADMFGNQILDYWKLGNKNCNDGILLLFVKDDATFELKWKKGAQSIINFRTATSMNKSFNQNIRRYSLEHSILRGKDGEIPSCEINIAVPHGGDNSTNANDTNVITKKENIKHKNAKILNMKIQHNAVSINSIGLSL
ncbi:MOLO1 domain-containing protein [Plasmodium brasilianum]|uniref:MOLO1 domain-containing protein n=1 Tax=Plasmodium brasilianum TaxID=5824 RepID=A0ACB9YEU3_PLABR|nr:MOLO1 domain-containing protein [Plasmodium brasilianum]